MDLVYLKNVLLKFIEAQSAGKAQVHANTCSFSSIPVENQIRALLARLLSSCAESLSLEQHFASHDVCTRVSVDPGVPLNLCH